MFRRHVLKDLSSYIDNQLSERKKQKVENHLKECKICSEELAKLKLLSEKLKTWQVAGPDSNFESSVSGGIVQEELKKEEVKMKNKTWTILIPSGVIAGILVFLFVGQTYLKRNMQGQLRTATDEIVEQYSPNKKQYESDYLSRQIGKDMLISKAVGHEKVSEKVSYGDLGDLRFEGTATNQFVSNAASEGGFSKISRVSPAESSGYKANLEASLGEGSVIVIQPSLPAIGEGDKIIRYADVWLEVKDGADTYTRAGEICVKYGGYIHHSDFRKDTEGREAGSITMRIPKEKYAVVLDELRGLGIVENVNTSSQDVSQQYVSLKAELEAAMKVYEKALEALKKRQPTVSDAVRMESELTPILKRVENLKNQLDKLENSVNFATVNIYFHEPKVSLKVLKETKKDIQQSMITARINAVKLFAKIIKAIPNIIVFVVWAAIVIAALFLLKYWIVRLFKRE